MLIFFVSMSQLAGIIGSFFTFASIPTWYAGLTKPSFSPPSYVFGPAWIILYTLMGVSTWLVWKRTEKISTAIKIFLVHLFFNCTWSIIFFGMKNLGLALIDIVIIWGFIVVLIYKYSKESRLASILLIPYLLWVSFASILNLSIFILNK